MKLQRLIAILIVLLQNKRASAPYLAEKFEVSVRTIYRDIAALESAGIPIVTHTGANGGFSVIEQYKIDKKLFTNQDIATLLTGLRSISGPMPQAQVNLTLEKIKSLIPREYGASIELTSRQLYIDMTPWAANPRISEAMNQIRVAMEKSCLLRFSYESRAGESSLRITEPHQLVLKENNWYLRAFCKKRQDFRVFLLRRMQMAEMLSEMFTPRDFESRLPDFKEWKHDRSIVVELMMDAELKERALDYCPEENIRDVENGKIRVSLPFVESRMGYGVLLGFGSGCEVLSPVHVRKELMRRVEEIRLVYSQSI